MELPITANNHQHPLQVLRVADVSDGYPSFQELGPYCEAETSKGFQG